MRELIVILLISLIGLLVGAAVLGCFLSGLLSLLAAPLLAFFGWFTFVPIAICVAILWAVCPISWSSPWQRFAFIQANGVAGFLLMLLLLGMHSSDLHWVGGLVTGGYLAASVCATFVIWLKPRVAERP